MVKMVAPPLSFLAPDLVKSYSPAQDKISTWHTVSRGHRETLDNIARKYGVTEERLVEFNFPGSVKVGRLDPDVVNWYLFNHQRTRCREVTQNGHNYMFSGGERIAIPYLGSVEIGEVMILAPTNTKFKIKQHANLNVSFGLAADFSIFQIWDQKASKCSFYTFWAPGSAVSKGLTPGWLSATNAGPWNDLVVTQPIAVNQFVGPTTFATGGGGNETRNYISFMGLPRGTHTIPSQVPLKTGFTFGIGGGASFGDMTLEMLGTSDGLLPFKGP